jgi:hypothetical protein
MALITDPDELNQGESAAATDLSFSASTTGIRIRALEGTSAIPVFGSAEYFEIRGVSTVDNNGLYRVNDMVATSASVTAVKITGPAATTVSALGETIQFYGAIGSATEKSVMFDTDAKKIYLLEQGFLGSAGVTMLAFHSFAKEEWKEDDTLISNAEFPMVGISFAAGQWQFGTDPSGNNSGWAPADDVDVSAVSAASQFIKTRRLFRNAGWDEIDASGNTIRKYFNVTTLGSFEDASTDLAYYRFGGDPTDTSAAKDYEFPGVVNEPVLFFREFGSPTGTHSFATTNTITRASSTGSHFINEGYAVSGQVNVREASVAANNGVFTITTLSSGTITVSGTPFTVDTDDQTAQLAVDNSNSFTTFIRVRDADLNGKTFGQANLANAGEDSITSKIIKFPLANATDLDVSATDTNIVTSAPWTQISVRYFDQSYERDVDTSGTPRSYGIVVDAGTHSGVDGALSVGDSDLTTAEGGIVGANFIGGTIRIHDGTHANQTFQISGTPTATIVATVTALSSADTNVSFTLDRATPVVPTKNEIYEKVHYLLRQSQNINSAQSQGIINGNTADDLAVFVGADLRMGSLTPFNPNGGGSGVIIEGFNSNDTNNLFFFDNGGTSRNFPFVAAGTLTFNQGLVDDTDGEYWLYFAYTNRVTNSDIDTVGPSGDTYDLEGTLGTYLVNDYLQISGFAQAENNGLFIVTVVNVSGSDYTVRKVDGTDVGTAETNQTVSVDENPYPSPDAIIVQDNNGSNIAANISTVSVNFDFDYDNNVQGGRTAATDANVVLVAAGLETAQVAVVKNLTITRSTGLSFSITAAQERNYSNP